MSTIIANCQIGSANTEAYPSKVVEQGSVEEKIASVTVQHLTLNETILIF